MTLYEGDRSLCNTCPKRSRISSALVRIGIAACNTDCNGLIEITTGIFTAASQPIDESTGVIFFGMETTVAPIESDDLKPRSDTYVYGKWEEPKVVCGLDPLKLRDGESISIDERDKEPRRIVTIIADERSRSLLDYAVAMDAVLNHQPTDPQI